MISRSSGWWSPADRTRAGRRASGEPGGRHRRDRADGPRGGCPIGRDRRFLVSLVALVDVARAVCDLGQPTECLRLLDESETFAAPPDVEIVVKRPATRALALARLGRLDEARTFAAEAVSTAAGRDYLNYEAEALLAQARGRALLGRLRRRAGARSKARFGVLDRKGNMVLADEDARRGSRRSPADGATGSDHGLHPEVLAYEGVYSSSLEGAGGLRVLAWRHRRRGRGPSRRACRRRSPRWRRRRSADRGSARCRARRRADHGVLERSVRRAVRQRPLRLGEEAGREKARLDAHDAGCRRARPRGRGPR